MMTVTESNEKQEQLDHEYSQEIYHDNQAEAKLLKPKLTKFFKDCQVYFYTTAEPSLVIEQELAELIERLKLADEQNISAEEVLGMDGPDYCKKALQELDVTYYRRDTSYYSKYIVLFLIFTYTIYSLFEFFRGYLFYGELTSAFHMPVSLSILGLPLQILTLITALFFFFQFRRNSSFNSTWYYDNNLLYLLASLASAISSAIIPFISLYYNVLVIHLPVWLVLFLIIFAYIYIYVFPQLNIDRFIDNRIESRQLQNKEETSDDTATEDNLSNIEQDIKVENPTIVRSIWNTIKTGGPLLTRQTYRKEIKKQDKDKKEDQK